MLKRADKNKFLPGYWEIPGGIIEEKEDPVSGLQREIKEESGLDIKVSYPLKVVSYYHDPTHPRESYGIFYLCRLKNENQKVVISHEHSDYKWASFDKIPDIQINTFLKNLLEEFKNSPLLTIS